MIKDDSVSDIVVQLHSIARELEKQKMLRILADELRDLSDRLSRVHSNHIKHKTSDPLMLNYLNIQDDEWI